MSKYSVNHLFYSLISGVIALFFLMLGIIAILVATHSTIRAEIIHFISTSSLLISLFGILLSVIGIGFFIHIFYQLKKQNYRIKAGFHSTEVEEEVFHSYLQQYWKDLFPHQEISNAVFIKENKVQIEAELPWMSALEQKELLEQVQKDLDHLFPRFFGYRDEYLLHITFQSPPNLNKTPQSLTHQN